MQHTNVTHDNSSVYTSSAHFIHTHDRRINNTAFYSMGTSLVTSSYNYLTTQHTMIQVKTAQYYRWK